MVLVISIHFYIGMAPLPAVADSSCHPLPESKYTHCTRAQSEMKAFASVHSKQGDSSDSNKALFV